MDSHNPLLGRVRKLLAKAEAQGVTPRGGGGAHGKAAELMARYGIDGPCSPPSSTDTDHPADRKLDIDNPWARVQAHLLCGWRRDAVASASSCHAAAQVPGSTCSASHPTSSGPMCCTRRCWADVAGVSPRRTCRPWTRSVARGRELAAGVQLRGGGPGPRCEQRAAAPGRQRPRGCGGRAPSWCLADRAKIVQHSIEHAYRSPVDSDDIQRQWLRRRYSPGQRAHLGGARLAATNPAGPWERRRINRKAGLVLRKVTGTSGEPGPLVRSMPRDAARCVPGGGSSGVFRLVSLAGAVGSATGLSLRSPPGGQDLFRDAGNPPAAQAQSHSCPLKNILPARGPAGCPSRPITPCVPSGAGTHHNPGPPAGTSAKAARMNLTSSAETLTCARPGCGATITLADSVYVDGCGQICPGCDEDLFGTVPAVVERRRAPLLGRGSAALGAAGTR